MENKKEKKYVQPTLEIIVFEGEDIICTSPANIISDEELIPW